MFTVSEAIREFDRARNAYRRSLIKNAGIFLYHAVLSAEAGRDDWVLYIGFADRCAEDLRDVSLKQCHKLERQCARVWERCQKLASK